MGLIFVVMPTEDLYLTINEKAEGLFKDKGSKFIAYAYPFERESELKRVLEEVKSLHPKARHHCFAYKIGKGADHFRANDDGEPSGSAGRPILNAILSAGLTNVLIVVVRYFGGTLLGVPGLINAYKSAAADALSGAVPVEKYIRDVYLFSFPFEKMNEIMKIAKEFELKILSQTYENGYGLELEIRQTQVKAVLARLEDIREAESEYLRTV